jgi:hypothetical protein
VKDVFHTYKQAHPLFLLVLLVLLVLLKRIVLMVSEPPSLQEVLSGQVTLILGSPVGLR